jgi:hypothetical protein
MRRYVVAGLLAVAVLAEARPIIAHPCKQSLSACPSRGCAAAGSHRALINQTKRAWPPQGSANVLALDDFTALQTQADKLFKQRTPLDKDARGLLKNMRIPSSGEHVSEGDLVQVAGYIVGVHANPGESVNCGLTGQRNGDYHIVIARQPNHSEFRGIVVEMIPQRRAAEWTKAKVDSLAGEQRQVLIRGQLMYDNMHLVNKDPANPKGGQPKRFSLWELHPVTEIHVCPAVACDPSGTSGWQRRFRAQ